jgi:GNAT superfamily N-acetyltransferase
VIEGARPATADDLVRIVQLAGDLRGELREMRGGRLWEARESRPEPLTESYRDLLASEDALLVVGTIDDVVIGFGTAEIEVLRDGGGPLGVIRDLFVEPEARAVGIGELIAELLVAHCEQHGCIGIDAVALPGHRDTKNFFERNGFTARALIMHKRL